jgi:hypothetical protein
VDRDVSTQASAEIWGKPLAHSYGNRLGRTEEGKHSMRPARLADLDGSALISFVNNAAAADFEINGVSASAKLPPPFPPGTFPQTYSPNPCASAATPSSSALKTIRIGAQQTSQS